MKNNDQTALLVMDMQAPMRGRLKDADAVFKTAAAAIDAARRKGMRIIYVVVGFRDGMPEISDNNKSFMAMRESMLSADMKAFMTIDDSVKPRDGEIVVIKRRVSAFSGSDLEVVLRSAKVQHLVMLGVATSGVVLSTTREAADKDYRITILSDACGDADPEVHRVLLEKVFPRQAEVLTVQKWMEQL